MVLKERRAPYSRVEIVCGTKRSAGRVPGGVPEEAGVEQRKVAYVFSYRNGIRERSVGVLRCTGTEPSEVTLELYGEAERKQRWRVYYFNRYGGLTEATFLWGLSTMYGTSEVKSKQCRLCAEAGSSAGVMLLPETTGELQPDFSSYLCARFDGTEVTEEELRMAWKRKRTDAPEENRCVESAVRLMEELTRAAGGETAREEVQEKEKNSVAEAAFRQGRGKDIGSKTIPFRRKPERHRIACLDELLHTKPSYLPCKEYDVEYSVRIAPEDFACFPKEGKHYAENSYVLHGYYRYRHLLLGRRTGKAKEEYLLMVPGMWKKKEAELAEFFGFREFLPMHTETGIAVSGEGCFGYYCGKI